MSDGVHDRFPKATKDQVRLALLQIKILLANKKYTFIPRRENLNTLTKFGLVPENIIDIINDLTYENYCNGPTDDRDRGDKKCMWEFGTQLDECDIYIKLKLTIDEIINISFHKAKETLEYHYKDE